MVHHLYATGKKTEYRTIVKKKGQIKMHELVNISFVRNEHMTTMCPIQAKNAVFEMF